MSTYEYIDNSDVIMFVIRRDRYSAYSEYDIIKKTSNILNVDIKDFELNYEKYIEKEYDKIYINLRLILEYRINLLNILIKQKNIREQKEDFIKDFFKNCIKDEIKYKRDFLIQKKCMDEIKEKLNKYLIKERHNPEWVVNKVMKEEDEWKNDGEYLYDICFYKVCPEIEEILLNKVDSLYAFDPPYLPEDICFYKDGYCWLGTLTHEEWAFIYIDNKEDYNYLKKIGIKLKKYSDENNKNEKNYEDGIAY